MKQYPDWLRKAAAKGGKAKSVAKTAAARKANAARWRNHHRTFRRHRDNPLVRETARLKSGGLRSGQRTLPKQVQTVLRERFWNGKTLEATGKGLKRTPARVRQIEAKALRMLRHPTRLSKIQACGLES